MEHKNRRILMITVACIAAGLLLVAELYISQLTKATENMTRATMEELAAHDSRNIQGTLEGYWSELESVYDRLLSSDIETIQDLCSRLNVEQISNTYTRIFMVDEHGNTYSGINRIINQANREHVKKLLGGSDRIAMNYEYKEDRQVELRKEVLAVGLKTEPYTVQDTTFVAIVGFIDVNALEKDMKLSCFDGAGRTTVIDSDGYYIVNKDRSEGMARRDNYFNELAKNCKNPADHIGKIRKQILVDQEFYDEVECGLPNGEVAYYRALDHTDWIMIITVPKKVIADMGNYYVKLTGMLLFAMISIFLVSAIVLSNLSLKNLEILAASKARSEFLSMMSHEIRTPLNGLIGLNYLMRSNLNNEEKMKEYLRNSTSTAQYLQSLINDVLDMSKLQSGKMELYSQPFSITYMISAIDSIIRGKMDDKRIQFQVKQDVLADTVIGDEMRVKQILINILGNASKFTDEGGHVEFLISQKLLSEKQVETVYRVKDDGCGMTEEFQKKIFETFEQENRGEKNALSGTGLGMPISFQLAQQMGGNLTIESEVGVGSTFIFTLKQEISDEKPDTVIVSGTPEHSGGANRTLKILLAEDHDLNAEILMELLQDEGFVVTRAADGVEVVELFEQSEPYTYDLILMDVQMPNRNGYEATRTIRAMERKDAKSVVIYACTANAFKEDVDMALESGMDDFVTKPINVEKLMRKLDIKFYGGGKN